MELKYFKIEEFACRCCGQGADNMDEDFLMYIDYARRIAGIPFVISSGYRCAKHNEEVGGKITSSHLKGKASDILIITDLERYKILQVVISLFPRIGIGKDFVHIDNDKEKPWPRIWVYPSV